MMDPRASEVNEAHAEEWDGRPVVLVNGAQLTTPGGKAVEPPTMELAEALAAELEVDGVADVTRPSLYAFYSAQRDFIEADPGRTIDALLELLAHDYLLHPFASLGRRQAQIAAWGAQIRLWQEVAGREPPFASPVADANIKDADYSAFRAVFSAFTPAQLSVAINAANLLKSVTLGILLAQFALEPDAALEAAAITLRLQAGESQEELERQEEREEEVREVIARLLRYAELSEGR